MDFALVSLKAYNLFVVTPILILNTVPVRRLVWLCFCKSIGSLYTKRAEGPGWISPAISPSYITFEIDELLKSSFLSTSHNLVYTTCQLSVHNMSTSPHEVQTWNVLSRKYRGYNIFNHDRNILKSRVYMATFTFWHCLDLDIFRDVLS